VYLAHSPVDGVGDSVIDHLQASADLAEMFAAEYAPFEARIAALLHDIGKYGDKFQQRLRGEIAHIDHWSLGAGIALTYYHELGIGAALAIQGHHIGLQRLQAASLGELAPKRLKESPPAGRILSTTDDRLLIERFRADGGKFPTPPDDYCSNLLTNLARQSDVAAMIDARMLFSAVVDADYQTTEAHFSRMPGQPPTLRSAGKRLAPDRLSDSLQQYLNRLESGSKAADSLRRLRQDLRAACLRASARPPGLFTLTAPTGAGKTLAALQFALGHANRNGLGRVVVVLPFLSLIEQTADNYRKALGLSRDDPTLIEDHSLADEDSDDGDIRLFSQNWDAPIIVTTTVRFFESLFANRPAMCRKLHNIAGSVIVLDEAQSLPLKLVPLTLAALSHLQSAYRVSVIVSTASQPAFSHLSDTVASHAADGWKTVEIAPAGLNLFERTRRLKVQWPELSGGQPARTRWEDVAAVMRTVPQACAIVNLKRQSRLLFELLREEPKGTTFHISADMCPAHRRDILTRITQRLKQGLPVHVVSTQCIEAGVDLDFPMLLRAWGPLDAIAQAAGRCNREGTLPYGDFRVFVPPLDSERYPDTTYANAAAVAKRLWLADGGTLDLQDVGLYARYYRELYDLVGLQQTPSRDPLTESIQTYDFVETAKQYRLIQQPTVNVLVPYGGELARYRSLAQAARERGFGRKWIRAARPLTVNLYQTALRGALGQWLEAVPDRDGHPTGWFVYLRESHYSDELGLSDPVADEVLIA